MIGRFQTALLIGSTKGNETAFRNAERELTKSGRIVSAPVLYGEENSGPWLAMLTDMCEAKMREADIVVIATPDHIGESTLRRAFQAAALGKPVYKYDPTIPELIVTMCGFMPPPAVKDPDRSGGYEDPFAY